ncbi:MAG: efflux RND transporter periplasmic adaptor subunit [Gammaproteobacteria bacterium]|nr:efflux RND transporter periplasmic adaptor subunit [Gammaproteobacteria bacterium]MBI5616861.1 efflux RND transporter periplasmic adaptor subunit [Gammaproteobacteria bacterium]
MSTAPIKLLAAAALGAALTAAVLHFQPRPQQQHDQQAAPAAAQSARRVLYWYDPMKPDQHFEKPGKSPFMDMALLPRYADEGASDPGIAIDPGLQQTLGIALVTVERGTLEDDLRAVGTLVYDPRAVAVVQARANGFVERVYDHAPGDVLAAGAPLADLLIPEWAGAEREFIALLGTHDEALLAAARSRLALAGLPPALIRRIEETRTPRDTVTVTAPLAGAITALNVRAGMTVSAGQTLAEIAALDRVWLEAAVPETEGAGLAAGTPLEVRLRARPGEAIAARVESVLPAADATTRTLTLRAALPNPARTLRPGLLAEVTIRRPAGEHLLVPSNAVIRRGEENIVIVADDAGRLHPQLVTLGREAGERVAVEAGLEAGQRIVRSGQFLIDSEANLRGVLARLPQAREPHTGHTDHTP